MYSWIPLRDGYPFAHNIDGIELTIIKTERHLDLTIITLYRSPQVPIPRLLPGLPTILGQHLSLQNVIIGDFNINWALECTSGVHTSFAL